MSGEWTVEDQAVHWEVYRGVDHLRGDYVDLPLNELYVLIYLSHDEPHASCQMVPACWTCQ